MKTFTKTFLTGLLVLPGLSCSPPASQPSTDSLTPTTHLEASHDLLELGRQVYKKKCVTCHGEKGDGQGEASYLLYPRPRNFVIRQEAVENSQTNSFGEQIDNHFIERVEFFCTRQNDALNVCKNASDFLRKSPLDKVRTGT